MDKKRTALKGCNVFAIEVIQFVMNGQLNLMLQHFKNFLGAAPEEEATVLFTLFVLFQLFNAFNCRELDDTPQRHLYAMIVTVPLPG